MRQGVRTSLALWCCLATIIAGQPAQALAERQPSAPTKPPVDIHIPENLGFVVGTLPPVSSSSPLVIHLQEAHANPEVQQRVADILEALVTEYGVQLILVEGGHGDVSLAYLRRYGPPENRRQVAGKYLRAGILSGEEYLDIVSDYPLTLWGVEDEPLYHQNVEALLAVDSLREQVQPTMALLEAAVRELTRQLADPRQQTLDAKTAAYRQGQLSLAEYTTFLQTQMPQAGLDQDRYPQLARFLRSETLNSQQTRDDVQRQQRTLITRLRAHAATGDLEALNAAAEAMKADSSAAREFYRQLSTTAGRVGITLNEFPQLAAYIEALEDQPLQPAALANELDQLAQQLAEAYADTPQRRQVHEFVQQHDLLAKLIDQRLTPEEHAQWTHLAPAHLRQTWGGLLAEHAAMVGSAAPSADELEALERALPTFERFYELATARDAALIRNTLDKLTASGQPLAALITGGFHAPQIASELSRQGVGVLMLAPRVTRPTDPKLYHTVMRYESGLARLQDVLAVAGEPATQPIRLMQQRMTRP